MKLNEVFGQKTNKPLNEEGPVGDEGALKYVFKLPKEGSFTANFDDGSSVTIDVDPQDESSGNYAFIGKDEGSVFKAWSSKPSKKEANDVLQRVKAKG